MINDDNAPHAAHYASLWGILLGDDLYANQPFCQHALDHDLHFLFVCKPDSHPTLYQWVETFAAAGKVETFSIRKWNGKFSELWTYRFLNQIPLRAGDDALPVNWCELRDRFIDLGIPLRIGPADKAEARAEAQALSSWFSQEDSAPTL